MDFWAFVMGMLTILFIVIPVFRWHAVYVLNTARQEAARSGHVSGPLVERLIVASTGAIGSTVLAVIGLNRMLGFPLWEPTSPVGFSLLVVALLLFSVPAFIWEWMYLTGRLER